MRWHPETISAPAQVLIKTLVALPELKDWYLAGGTGLALQCGHRISVDLDFFSSQSLFGATERETLKEKLSGLRGFRIRDEKEGTLHVLVHGVDVSFLRYSYPLVRRPLRWKGLNVASMQDIGLMKIGAIIGRGSRKDFRDLREICRKLPLAALLRLAPKKFPAAEDFLFQASKALIYFDDAQAEQEPVLLRKGPWEDVKKYFETEAPRVFKAVLQAPGN